MSHIRFEFELQIVQYRAHNDLFYSSILMKNELKINL